MYNFHVTVMIKGLYLNSEYMKRLPVTVKIVIYHWKLFIYIYTFILKIFKNISLTKTL